MGFRNQATAQHFHLILFVKDPLAVARKFIQDSCVLLVYGFAQ